MFSVCYEHPEKSGSRPSCRAGGSTSNLVENCRWAWPRITATMGCDQIRTCRKLHGCVRFMYLYSMRSSTPVLARRHVRHGLFALAWPEMDPSLTLLCAGHVNDTGTCPSYSAVDVIPFASMKFCRGTVERVGGGSTRYITPCDRDSKPHYVSRINLTRYFYFSYLTPRRTKGSGTIWFRVLALA